MGIGRDLIEDIKDHPDDEVGQKEVDMDAAGDTVLVQIALDQSREVKRGSHHGWDDQDQKDIGFKSMQYLSAGSIEDIIDDIVIVFKK
jgi:hypothetical protein